jgi:hypothetical protein
MLSTFALAVNNKFSYAKRWAILKVAGERVASEIYLYRARVGEYTQGSKDAKLLKLMDRHQEVADDKKDKKVAADDKKAAVDKKATADKLAACEKAAADTAAVEEAGDKKGAKAAVEAPVPAPAGNMPLLQAQSSSTAASSETGGDSASTQADQPKKRSSKKAATKASAKKQPSARDMFFENVNGIQSDMMASEVKMASLQVPAPGLQGGAKSILQLYDPRDHRKQTKKTSAAGDNSGEYEETDSSQTNALLALEEGTLSDFSLIGNAMMEDDGPDDGISLISAEDYIRIRMMPAVSRLNAEIPGHELWYWFAQVVIMLATMLAAMFGVIGLHAWIPSVTAWVACVESLSSFDQTSARLEGANGALARLKTLRIWCKLHNKQSAAACDVQACSDRALACTYRAEPEPHAAEDAAEQGDAGGGGGGGTRSGGWLVDARDAEEEEQGRRGGGRGGRRGRKEEQVASLRAARIKSCTCQCTCVPGLRFLTEPRRPPWRRSAAATYVRLYRRWTGSDRNVPVPRAQLLLVEWL